MYKELKCLFPAALLAAAAFNARASDEAAAYLVSALDGAPVTTAHGACLRTGDWRADSAYRDCGRQPFTVAIDALFAFDSAALTPQATEALDALAKHIAAAPYETVEIVGHADAIGRPDYNLKLSAQRANAVREHLAAHGIDRSKITVSGIGAARPLAAALCEGLVREELVACLQPDRYAGVTVKGVVVR